MKIRFNVVAISLYMLPALIYLYLTNLSKITFYEPSLFAIQVSLLFTIVGFLFGTIFSKKLNFKFFDFPPKIYLFIIKLFLFLAIGSVSIQLLKYGIPLLNNSLRADIQQGFLWNIFTLSSMLSLFFSSYVFFVLKIKLDFLLKILIFLLLVLTILTGWKGILINYIFIFSSFFILYKKIKISILFKAFIAFLVIFFGINAIRSGIYSINFEELFNYFFYGFENFVRIAPTYTSECLHSVPLLNSNCQFVYDNDSLINPTFNVYTALMPIYSDGGVVLVGIIFFIFSFLLGCIKDYKNSFFITFLFYLLHYFFMIAHNGYAFNSGSFVFVLFLLFVFDILRVK
ncbi:O-antigen polymerase [Acinetobacter calcoaceticus]